MYEIKSYHKKALSAHTDYVRWCIRLIRKIPISENGLYNEDVK